jgi:flagellar basal body-associated protein FliL
MIYTFVLFLEKAYAQSLDDRLGGVLESGQSEGKGAMQDFIQAFLDFAVPLGVFVAMVLLGYAGFVMVTSSGDPEKLKDAREVATNAVIGAVMIALGVIVLALLDSQLGITGN